MSCLILGMAFAFLLSVGTTVRTLLRVCRLDTIAPYYSTIALGVRALPRYRHDVTTPVVMG